MRPENVDKFANNKPVYLFFADNSSKIEQNRLRKLVRIIGREKDFFRYVQFEQFENYDKAMPHVKQNFTKLIKPEMIQALKPA